MVITEHKMLARTGLQNESSRLSNAKGHVTHYYVRLHIIAMQTKNWNKVGSKDAIQVGGCDSLQR